MLENRLVKKHGFEFISTGGGFAVKNGQTKTLVIDQEGDFVGGIALTPGSVDTAELASDAVTTDKIAANAVKSTQINSKAVTTAKLEDGSVTAEKLGDDVSQVVFAGLSTIEEDDNASVVIALTGAVVTDIPSVVLVGAANDIYVKKAVITADTLTVTLSGNGGAGTQVAYTVIRPGS